MLKRNKSKTSHEYLKLKHAILLMCHLEEILFVLAQIVCCGSGVQPIYLYKGRTDL